MFQNDHTSLPPQVSIFFFQKTQQNKSCFKESSRMKRNFEEYDRHIPFEFLNKNNNYKNQLKKIQQLENELLLLWCNYKRKSLILNNNTNKIIQNKILRIYLRHQFYPITSNNITTSIASIASTVSTASIPSNQVINNDKSYYLFTIEGRLLDLYIGEVFNFGLFFDTIKIQIDKKYGTDYQIYEWKKEQFLSGKKANCFQFKIYTA